MVNAPVISGPSGNADYNFSQEQQKSINAIQVDSNFDFVAGSGNSLSGLTDHYIWGIIAVFFTPAQEFYNDADYKVEYSDQFKEGPCSYSNHCGQEDENVKVWYPAIEKLLKKPQ